MSPSTAHPELLPEIASLRRLTQSLAMLDAILCPDWESRYYSYNAKWGAGEEMASMRDGCGDDWFLLFDRHGAALKGFAHESALANEPGFPVRIHESVPPDFGPFLHEPAFGMHDVTFCFWRRHTDPAWNVVLPTPFGGPERDGSAELLHLLDAKPETYRTWAQDYYEREVPLPAVQAIYAHEPLHADLVACLNPELAWSDADTAAAEINYLRSLGR